MEMTALRERRGPADDICDGCLDEGIRIVDMRHEQVAAPVA
jgi:hypothetical protein